MLDVEHVERRPIPIRCRQSAELVSQRGMPAVMRLKWVAGRHRPIDLFGHGSFGFSFFSVGYELNSFPSGHAQTAFSLAVALTLLFPRWGVPLFAVAGLIAVSRVVLTAHYLSDVIAGAGIGILFTMCVKYFFDRRGVDFSGNKMSIE